ncbi:MAG: hypothetical protein FWG64_13730 [Firmicutes bacterium]|nr:hypothetical protein [Bacillota bacterium]
MEKSTKTWLLVGTVAIAAIGVAYSIFRLNQARLFWKEQTEELSKNLFDIHRKQILEEDADFNNTGFIRAQNALKRLFSDDDDYYEEENPNNFNLNLYNGKSIVRIRRWKDEQI